MSKSVSSVRRDSPELTKSFDLMFILKAVSLAYVLSIILLFVTSLIATYQCLSDKGISVLVNVVTATCAIFAGFLSGRHSLKGGLLSGAVSGIIYTLLLCLIGNLISQTFSFGASSITAIIIGVVCGAVGGIVGINTKARQRR